MQPVVEIGDTLESITPPLDENLGLNANDEAHAANALLDLNTQTYYRSRIFTAYGNHNPLLSSAAVLLSLINRLRFHQNLPNPIELHHHLAHEIEAFSTQAHSKGYPQENIRLARYALCATLDEVLVNLQWQEHHFWETERFLTRFEGDADGSERFFLILERLIDNPKRHIHLLEIFYLCLSAGFEGKYRNNPEGKGKLDEWLDHLFFLIHKQYPESILSPQNETKNASIITSSSTFSTWVTNSFIFSFSAILLLCFYMSFDFVLGIRAEPLLENLKNIAQNTQFVIS